MNTELNTKLAQLEALAFVSSKNILLERDTNRCLDLIVICGLCLTAIKFISQGKSNPANSGEGLSNYSWYLMANLYVSMFSKHYKENDFQSWAFWASDPARNQKDNFSFFDFNKNGVTIQ